MTSTSTGPRDHEIRARTNAYAAPSALRNRVFFGVASAAFAIIAGCGSERPPAAGSSSGTGAGNAAQAGFSADAGSTKPPGCGTKSDGSYCDCVDVPLFGDPPNMYFVLDRSGSMQEENKWTQVRVVVAKILRSLGPRANFGAMVFPGLETAACAPAKEVMSLRPGDPPSTTDGPTTRMLLATTSDAPYGGTPTAQALRSVLERLRTVSGKTFVVLATDGGPNCNSAAACNFDQCMLNIENTSEPRCPPSGPNCCEPPAGFRESCLDSAATDSAVSALKAAGIPVYVIGLPGTAAYANLLDQLATSGGTALAASPKYYRVASTADNVALLSALKQIAAKIVATCEFKLKEAPAQQNQVNVYLDEVVVPKDPTNGWKIDGSTVTLLGKSCNSVMAGDVLDVRIITGCPTVEPR